MTKKAPELLNHWSDWFHLFTIGLRIIWTNCMPNLRSFEALIICDLLWKLGRKNSKDEGRLWNDKTWVTAKEWPWRVQPLEIDTWDGFQRGNIYCSRVCGPLFECSRPAHSTKINFSIRLSRVLETVLNRVLKYYQGNPLESLETLRQPHPSHQKRQWCVKASISSSDSISHSLQRPAR